MSFVEKLPRQSPSLTVISSHKAAMHNQAAKSLFNRATNLPISSPRLQLTSSGTASCIRRPLKRAGRKHNLLPPGRPNVKQSASRLPIVCATFSLCRLSTIPLLVWLGPHCTCQSHPAGCRSLLPLPNSVSSSLNFWPPCPDLHLRPCVIPYTPSPFRQTGQQCGKSEGLAPLCDLTEKPGAPRSRRRPFAKFLGPPFVG
ncbi:hypothetical protein ACQKWADRAFT_293054 [Trichoderma austrokoningii]